MWHQDKAVAECEGDDRFSKRFGNGGVENRSREIIVTMGKIRKKLGQS